MAQRKTRTSVKAKAEEAAATNNGLTERMQPGTQEEGSLMQSIVQSLSQQQQILLRFTMAQSSQTCRQRPATIHLKIARGRTVGPESGNTPPAQSILDRPSWFPRVESQVVRLRVVYWAMQTRRYSYAASSSPYSSQRRLGAAVAGGRSSHSRRR